MKKFFVLFLFLCSASTYAQDVIVKKDGSTILSKVLEVNGTEIKYKKSSNPNGPTYTISKSELLSVNYANGEKDDFSSVIGQSNAQQSGQGLIKKPADAENERIIKRHNVVYPNFKGKPASNKAAKYGYIKLGIKSSSVMSNEDVEMEFVRKITTTFYGWRDIMYYINIKNKTDRVLYVDKGNCFRVYTDGSSYCYFDASKQTTVNNGGGSGGSVNLGGLAGALGIGGAIGQIAGGVNVGGGTSSSVSTTYVSQRFIAIPPHGSKFLTEYRTVGTGKRETVVEKPEDFSLYARDMGLKRGVVNKKGTKVFDENELPWKREFFITYSTDDDFSSYSTLHAELYIQEIIGETAYLLELHEKGIWFQNENTIVDWIYLDKK